MSPTGGNESSITIRGEEQREGSPFAEGVKKKIDSIKEFAAEHPVDTARLIVEFGTAIVIGMTTPGLLESYFNFADPNHPTWKIRVTGIASDFIMLFAGMAAGSFESGDKFSRVVWKDFSAAWGLGENEKKLIGKLHPDWVENDGKIDLSVQTMYIVLKFLLRNWLAQDVIMLGTLGAGAMLIQGWTALMAKGSETIEEIKTQLAATNTPTIEPSSTPTLQPTNTPMPTFTSSPIPPTGTPIPPPELSLAGVPSDIQEIIKARDAYQFRQNLNNIITAAFSGFGVGGTLVAAAGLTKNTYRAGREMTTAIREAATAFNEAHLSPALQVGRENIAKIADGAGKIARGVQVGLIEALGGTVADHVFETESRTGTLTREKLEKSELNDYLKAYLESKLELYRETEAPFTLSDIFFDLLLVAVNYFEGDNFLVTLSNEQAIKILDWVYGRKEFVGVIDTLLRKGNERISVGADLNQAIQKYNALVPDHVRTMAAGGSKYDSKLWEEYHERKFNFNSVAMPKPPADTRPDFSNS